MLTAETYRGFAVEFDPLSIPGNEARGWRAIAADGEALFGPTSASVRRQVDQHLAAPSQPAAASAA
ncbi:MAG: hypothetical protein QM699_07575 [Amaricoccus sp.]|uniref:hypothetical protein n=1 Tax=Amaricoccus sp. TaxID=1872485 RepID=UPI0039E30F3D